MKKNIFIAAIFVIAALLVFSAYKFVFKGEKKTAEKIIVGTFTEFAPMTFKENGKNVGYDIDLIKEIAKRMGREVEFKEMSFPSLFDAVKAKEIDLAISSITITPERSKTVAFSIPYFDSGQSIVVRKDTEGVSKPEDLKYKKVGAIRNTTCEAAIKPYLADASQLHPYEEFFTEIDALKKGEIDAVVHDYTVVAYTAKNDDKIKVVGDPFTQEYYGIMANIEDTKLIAKVDEILREIKRDGTLKQIDMKWFGR